MGKLKYRGTAVLPRGFLALLGAALLSMHPLPAFAHNVVEGLSPEAGSVVTESPLAISIATDGTFLELGGESRGFAIAVLDTEGLYYGDGCVTLDERRMETLIDLGEPGPYTIVYQFVSSDGHSSSDSYDVSFAPGGSHTPAVGYSTPPQCTVERTAAEQPDTTEPGTEKKPSSVQALPKPTAETEPLNAWAISVGFAVILAVLASFALAARKKTKKPNPR
jgi:methionine-rich copper-binding protein CopC